MEIQMISDKSDEIARLNDAFRKDLSKGILMLSHGIHLNTVEDIEKIISIVRNYKTFKRGNDPYGERDFGTFNFKGRQIFWKIDYYDKELTFLSPDATDPSLTIRVLTIMYAEEY